jgi:hypothetical protein
MKRIVMVALFVASTMLVGLLPSESQARCRTKHTKSCCAPACAPVCAPAAAPVAAAACPAPVCAAPACKPARTHHVAHRGGRKSRGCSSCG